MVDDTKLTELEATAKNIRKNLITMMGFNKAHHFGGSLSCVEIITALYFYKLRVDPQNPNWVERDRFIISKGHSVPTQYVALALLGFFPLETLKSIKQMGSILQGHPNARLTPGVEAATGSLGLGLSFGNGVALGLRLLGIDSRVYVLLGDGELQEGQIWEAAMTTPTRKLNSLTAIIDANHLKAQGRTFEAKNLEPLSQKWLSFNWNVISVDGHDVGQLCDALDRATQVSDQPTVIIAKTTKGKGISFMEDQLQFHNSAITKEQWEQAMNDVGNKVEES